MHLMIIENVASLVLLIYLKSALNISGILFEVSHEDGSEGVHGDE